MVMVTENWTCLVFEWSNVVRSQNGPVFKCHLNTGLNLIQYSGHHFEYQTSEYPTSKISYPDVSVIQLFVIQIPITIVALVFMVIMVILDIMVAKNYNRWVSTAIR